MIQASVPYDLVGGDFNGFAAQKGVVYVQQAPQQLLGAPTGAVRLVQQQQQPQQVRVLCSETSVIKGARSLRAHIQQQQQQQTPCIPLTYFPNPL